MQLEATLGQSISLAWPMQLPASPALPQRCGRQRREERLLRGLSLLCFFAPSRFFPHAALIPQTWTESRPAPAPLEEGEKHGALKPSERSEAVAARVVRVAPGDFEPGAAWSESWT